MKSSSLKTVVRVILCLTAVGAILLVAHVQDLGDQYGVVDYFTFSVLNVKPNRPDQQRPVGHVAGDKVIVMAKMEHEDTSWVTTELPEYVRQEGAKWWPRVDSFPAGSTQFTQSTLLQALQMS